ncbi:MAG: ABC transporter ATP-binding protein, partial [Holosporaceae bacterium]
FLGYVFRHCGRRGQWAAVAILATSVLAVLTEAFLPYAYKLVTNAILASTPGTTQAGWMPSDKALGGYAPTIASALTLLAILMLSRVVIYRLRGLVMRYGWGDVSNFTRESLFRYLLQHSQQFFQDHFAGSLANQIRRVAEAGNQIFWGSFVQAFIPTVIYSLVSFFLLFNIAPSLAYSLLGWIVGLLAVVAFLSYRSVALNYASSESYSALSAVTVDAVSNASAIKLFSHQHQELQRFNHYQEDLTDRWKRAALFQDLIWGAFDVAVALLMVAFSWLIYQKWQQQQLSVGDISLIIVLIAQLCSQTVETVYHITMFYEHFGTIKEGLSKITRPIELTDAPGAQPIVVPKGEIVFDQLCFSYKSGRDVFDSLSLTIPAGQKVGLVGFSGAGKTTLCQLLLRNYDLNSGQILIDGQNIATVTQDSLRAQIAVIPQDTSLFHRSLAENIGYGRPDASMEEIVAAAKAAEAHEFIMTMPAGYETMVGERGIKLSGGQRQRIAIARAILKNAPILLLDEATSALDSVTERLIQTALNHAMAGRTTIVVAHRLATLTNLDRLIVLEHGQVIEDGSLSELLARNGRFAQLWQMQAGGFLPDNAN